MEGDDDDPDAIIKYHQEFNYKKSKWGSDKITFVLWLESCFETHYILRMMYGLLFILEGVSGQQ